VAKRKRRGRTVDGILLVDKLAGMTSNEALQAAKHLFDAQKAGHTGSLDPMATGLLPICLGEATKVSAFLLDADKYYRFTVRLGERTDSGDADGQVIATRTVSGIDRAMVETAVKAFDGEIEQIPPMHSAVKQQGKPLYEYAHRGQTVERAPRRTRVHRIEVADFDGHDVTLDVACAKGTYVRTLADDLGERLGCGGHIGGLRRTGAGPFVEPRMVTLETMREHWSQGGAAALDRFLEPVDAALAEWPEIEVGSDVADFLRQGQGVQVPKAPAAGMLRLYERDGGFIGMGRVLDDGRIGPKRLMNR
jgi:tRNA pseudouridine55 synthase